MYLLCKTKNKHVFVPTARFEGFNVEGSIKIRNILEFSQFRPRS